MSDTTTLFSVNINDELLKLYFKDLINELRSKSKYYSDSSIFGNMKWQYANVMISRLNLIPSEYYNYNIDNHSIINKPLATAKEILNELIMNKLNIEQEQIIEQVKFYTVLYTILHVYSYNDFIKSAKDLTGLNAEVSSSNQQSNNKYKNFLNYINFMNNEMYNFAKSDARTKHSNCITTNRQEDCPQETYTEYIRCLTGVKYNAEFEQLNGEFAIDAELLRKENPQMFEIYFQLYTHLYTTINFKFHSQKFERVNNISLTVEKLKTILLFFREILKLNLNKDKCDKLINLILDKYLYSMDQLFLYGVDQTKSSESNEVLTLKGFITLPKYLQRLLYIMIKSNDIEIYFTNEQINDKIYDVVESNTTIVEDLLYEKFLMHNIFDNESLDSNFKNGSNVSLLSHIVTDNFKYEPFDFKDINVLLLYLNLYTIITMYCCFLNKNRPSTTLSKLKRCLNNAVNATSISDDNIIGRLRKNLTSGGSDRPKKLNVNAKFIKKSYKKNKNSNNKRKFKNKSKKYKA